jgi:hypothetical protein
MAAAPRRTAFGGAAANLADLMASIVGIYLLCVLAYGQCRVVTELKRRSTLGEQMGEHRLGPVLALVVIAWTYVPLRTSLDSFLISVLVRLRPCGRVLP